MNDHLLHAIDLSRGLSVVVAETTQTAQEAETRHFAGRVPAVVLAKTLTGAALLSSGLKQGEKQSVQISFEGEMRGVMAEVDSAGNIRAYPTPIALPGVDDSGLSYTVALGGGATMAVVRSVNGTMVYSGSIHATRPEPRFCFEAYLDQSEQAQAAVELCVRYQGGGIENSRGVILRLLPGGDQEAFAVAKARFSSGEVFEKLQDVGSPEAVASMLLVDGHEGDGSLAVRQLRFLCTCSRQRVVGMLNALGAEQLRQIAEEDGSAEVNCSFCNSVYEVPQAELEAMIASLEGSLKDAGVKPQTPGLELGPGEAPTGD